MAKGIKSKPASQYDKLDITGMSIEQIVEIGEQEKENIKNKPIKTVVTNAAKVTAILSTELDLGMTIKVEDGGRPEEDMTK